jgi:tRNA nucleotidyltransferase (CCA-adding enzyme)
MEVYGMPADALRNVLERLFPQRVHDAGVAFGIFKVVLEDGASLDVALPRRDSKVAAGHRGFVIQGDPTMLPTEAVRRRDFTINALLADPTSGELTDLIGGLEDLQRGTLRAVDPEHFAEDPLRAYRALQLTARFELTLDDETTTLIRQMVEHGDLDQLAKERVTEELKKLLLLAERPSRGLTLAKQLGIVEREWPELHVLEATEQEHEWHPEGNVWIHTLMVIDQAARIIRQPERGFSTEEKVSVMIGALCHDLGKPPTTKFEEGRIRSRGHEAEGVEVAASFMKRFTFGETAERTAQVVAGEHLKPVMLVKSLEQGQMTRPQFLNAVRKLVKRIYPVSWRVLLAASEADLRGRAFADADACPYTPGALFADAVAELGLEHEAPKPLLQGRDLAELGVEPGPSMGELIAHAEHLRDEGTITTKDEALTAIRKLIQSN